MIFPWFFDGDLTLIFFDNLFLSEFLFNLCLNFEIFAHFLFLVVIVLKLQA